MSVFPRLFKYLSPDGIDLLVNRRLKVTPLSVFNDVFEFRPVIQDQIQPELIESLGQSDNILREIYRKGKSDGVINGSFAQFAAEYQRSVGQNKSAIADAATQLIRREVAKWPDKLCMQYGVVCLSAVRDCELMWAHYAQYHRGLVVELDISGLPDVDLRLVHYSQDRPTLDLSVVQDAQLVAEAGDRLLWTKSIKWKYEREWRAKIPKRCLETDGAVDTSSVYLLLPPEAIRSVIIGIRTNEDLRDRVVRAMDTPDLKHASCLQACMHETDFKIVIHKLKPGDN
ncbi:MAG: DUF2971 domain-containing protein [Lentisphaerae bacterium]|nr:DUF2971 domain-containing protein [Lentisphaerota bacterium]